MLYLSRKVRCAVKYMLQANLSLVYLNLDGTTFFRVHNSVYILCENLVKSPRILGLINIKFWPTVELT